MLLPKAILNEKKKSISRKNLFLQVCRKKNWKNGNIGEVGEFC